MIPAPFEYHAPKSLAEATRLLDQFGEDAKLLAGGHSLIPLMKLRLASPRKLIDLSRIPELNYIREEGAMIQIGAMTTHFQIESSSLLKQKCPLLPETAREIGDAQVRNKGTIGGSLAHADPAADWPAAVLALDAELAVVSARGERRLAVADFFKGALETALEPDEILASVRVPALPPRAGDAYVKHHQPASGFAVVGVATRVELDEKGQVARARVAVTGVAEKAYRASAVEEALRGKPPDVRRLEGAAAHAADGVEPNSDLYASGEYRRHLTSVLARRALERATKCAAGK